MQKVGNSTSTTHPKKSVSLRKFFIKGFSSRDINYKRKNTSLFIKFEYSLL